MRLLLGCAVSFAAMFSSVAQAQQTLDQSYTPASPESYVGAVYNGTSGTIVRLAQTFTVGQVGQLTQVDFDLVPALNESPLVIRILPTSSGALSSTLASASYQPNTIAFGYRSVTFPSTPSLAVVPGEVLAISLSVDVSNGINTQYGWLANNSNYAPNGLYTFGNAYTWTNQIPSWTPIGLGTSFGSHTFVTPTPEPSSILLFGTLLVLVRPRRTNQGSTMSCLAII